MESSIYEEMKAVGIEIGHHESDLYAKVTPESERIVAGYRFRRQVNRFISNIDNELWFDIPFAFNPFWENK